MDSSRRDSQPRSHVPYPLGARAILANTATSTEERRKQILPESRCINHRPGGRCSILMAGSREGLLGFRGDRQPRKVGGRGFPTGEIESRPMKIADAVDTNIAFGTGRKILRWDNLSNVQQRSTRGPLPAARHRAHQRSQGGRCPKFSDGRSDTMRGSRRLLRPTNSFVVAIRNGRREESLKMPGEPQVIPVVTVSNPPLQFNPDSTESSDGMSSCRPVRAAHAVSTWG